MLIKTFYIIVWLAANPADIIWAGTVTAPLDGPQTCLSSILTIRDTHRPGANVNYICRAVEGVSL